MYKLSENAEKAPRPDSEATARAKKAIKGATNGNTTEG
jgi:hypothetical protein